MAQVSIAAEPIASGYQSNMNGTVAAADLDEIREYQKIVNFRDTVVSGKHPRIKVAKPATPQQFHSLATERVAPSTNASNVASNVNAYQVDNMQSFKANAQQPTVVQATRASTTTVSGSLRVSSTDANHVSKKPEDLVKAELQLQRQRIEQDLKAQLAERKASMKAASQPFDQLPDLDLADILAKALTLVQATAPLPTATSPNITNASDSSDSFDNNTFYSSQHDTPEYQVELRNQNTAPRDITMQNTPATMRHQTAHIPQHQENTAPQPLPRPTPSYQTNPSRNTQPVQVTSSSRQSQSNTGGLVVPSQDHAIHHSSTTSREGDLMVQPYQIREVEAQVISSDSAAASRSGNSSNAISDQPADHSRIQNTHHLLPSAQFRQQGSPLVRAHDLSPLAPQPNHVSPLATARRPPMPEPEPEPEPELSILPGAPAQVAALRQEHGVVTSPESSPQGDKGGKKKNKKRNNNNNNKRKAETRAPDVPGSPYIKPEPRSPSPLTAPHFVRSQKRLRSGTRPEQDLVYEESRIERPASTVPHDQYTPTLPRLEAERLPYGLERVDDPYTRQVRQSVAPVGHRLDRSLYEEQRPDGAPQPYIRRLQSPYAYTAPYGAVESRPMRSASYTVNPQYREIREVPAYQRDGRMSARPYVDRARSRSPIIIERRSPVMAPPAPPPARIIVDQYGREYIDPPRTSTVSRHSVVPAPRPGEREIIYERIPMRAPSRMPPGEAFAEDEVIYQHAPPAYGPRRVVTQPEYGVDYRSYRERDYSVQPLGAPGHPIRGAAERRIPEEIARDYLPRATSVRPAETAPYYNRLGTVRPDVPPRQYAASVHPEVRREAVAPAIREFSVRPAERDAPRREYGVRPVERYYDRQLHPDEEAAYLERPRAAQQEIIYADNSQRQVYQ
ncbi:hypothetical protein F4819DRAFT_451283 [Hypoxylon fuscum]|nr:hypothetical protein F4819DRAFT_451283 [Hypoxylon fuscum]